MSISLLEEVNFIFSDRKKTQTNKKKQKQEIRNV